MKHNFTIDELENKSGTVPVREFPSKHNVVRLSLARVVGIEPDILLLQRDLNCLHKVAYTNLQLF